MQHLSLIHICAKERKAAGFDAPEIGTFLHYLLENVNREVKARGGYGAVERAALRGLVRQYLEKYSEEQLGGCREKSARFRYLFSRLRTTAYAIVENVADELSQSDFVPLEFELGFGGRDGRLPAITIREGESTLAVTGKVDRVDGWLRDGKLYIRVVDYKTGKKSFDLTDLRYGLGVQMLLYLFAVSYTHLAVADLLRRARPVRGDSRRTGDRRRGVCAAAAARSDAVQRRHHPCDTRSGARERNYAQRPPPREVPVPARCGG